MKRTKSRDWSAVRLLIALTPATITLAVWLHIDIWLSFGAKEQLDTHPSAKQQTNRQHQRDKHRSVNNNIISNNIENDQ